MKIYVGNLPFDCDSAQLTDLFGRYGEVTSAQIITDRDSGRSRGFGFVEMGDEQARAAIAGLEGTDLGGRSLTVNEAKPRVDRGRPSAGRDGNRPERSRW